MPVVLRRSQGGGAVSYERGHPVGHSRTDGSMVPLHGELEQMPEIARLRQDGPFLGVGKRPHGGII